MALTPKSRFFIVRVNATDATRPSATPTSASFIPCPITSFSTSLALRAERHPNADFARALRDRVRHQAVNPEAGERQRDDGEDGQQQHGETPGGDRLRHRLFHRAHVEDRLIFIQSRHLAAHR